MIIVGIVEAWQKSRRTPRAIDGVLVCAKCGYLKIDNVCLGCESKAPPRN